MILHLKDLKDSTKKKPLRHDNTFGNLTRHKINIQKSVAFLHTKNKKDEKEARKIISFTIALKTSLGKT
jgi:hypothetical protein